MGGTCAKGHELTESTVYSYPEGSRQYGTIRCAICKLLAKDKSRGTSREDFRLAVATVKRTHCPQGHFYDEDNTYITKNNKRQCKICSRERDYLRKYGITIAQYDEMFNSQNGLCAICKLDSEKRLCVDHNHTTGEVRELLCDNCNVGIARFHESIDSLKSAIEYLHRHT